MSGRRRALIVANDEYENEGLRQLISPSADADALGRVLGDPQIGGFEVQVVRNEPAHVISSHVEDLFSEGRPDDVLLLHFSCHGLKSDSGELFFAAGNTRPNRLGSTAVSAGFVQRCMHASRSRSVVLLLDCCYGGAFGQGVAVRASGEVNLLDSFPSGRLGGGRGRAVISASNSMEYAFEGDRLADEHGRTPSVFTAALVEGLASGDADRDEDGWVSLNELYDFVFDRVRAQNPNQTPSRDVEMQGELYLARSRRRRIRPQAIPPDLRAAMTDANMFSRIGAVTELRARLVGDNLPAAIGAYEALGEIAATDIRYVADAASEARQAVRIQPSVTEVELGRGHTVEVRLLGPPLARACTFRTDDAWIRLAGTDGGFTVSADPAVAGVRHGTVTLTGPTGEVALPVSVETVAAEEPAVLPAQREPAPAPADEPVVAAVERQQAQAASAPPQAAPVAPPAAPVAPQVAALAGPAMPEPTAPTEPAEPTTRRPGALTLGRWLGLAALAAGAIALIVINWPGESGSRYAWNDEDTPWYVNRFRWDAYLVASFLALGGALAVPLARRQHRLPLGVVAGSTLFLVVTAVTLLAGDLAYDQVVPWIGCLVIGAAMAAGAVRLARPQWLFARPRGSLGLGLAGAGAVLTAVAAAVPYDGVSFLKITYGLSVLDPLAALGLLVLALSVTDRATRQFLAAVAVVDVALEMLAMQPAWVSAQWASVVLAWAGGVLFLASALVAVLRRDSVSDVTPPEGVGKP